ncbi:hypothetical protein Mulvp2_41 [Enterobacter phage Mulvp2]|nr:hypothetical protein Mulvp2_41 [Enterobacter phage Mulvp2]
MTQNIPAAAYSYGRTAANGAIQVDDDFLPALRGELRKRVFTQMSRNDETLGALRTLITAIMLTVPWEMDAAESDTSKEYADLARDIIIDSMGDPADPYPGCTFNDFLQNCYTVREWGYGVFDVWTYKRQDGRIGIKEMVLIGQNSVEDWEVDEFGRATAVNQFVPVVGITKTITRDRYVHIINQPNCGSPEGESMYRYAYKPWYYKKRLQEIEAIQAERGTGMPLLYVDAQLAIDAESSNTETANNAKALLGQYTRMLRDVRQNKESGLLIFASPYESTDAATGRTTFSTMRTAEFEFATPSASNAVDLDKVIRRYDIGMARTVLADFLFLGTSGSGGNRSLSDNSTSLFLKGVQAFMETIASTLNRQLLPMIWKLNGLPEDMMPTMRVGTAMKESLTTLGTYIRDLAGAGALTPDEALESFLREEGGLPERSDELTRGTLPQLSVEDQQNAPQ